MFKYRQDAYRREDKAAARLTFQGENLPSSKWGLFIFKQAVKHMGIVYWV